MHGLISDRFLKRFAGGILRRQKSTPPQPTQPADESGKETEARSEQREDVETRVEKDAGPAEHA